MQLSGESSMMLTHQLRAAHDAILVGIGTVQADNPSLTVRLVSGENPQPIILDSHLRFEPGTKLGTHSTKKPWVACLDSIEPERKEILESVGITILQFPGNKKGLIPLALVLKKLAELGVKRLMVEGGACVLSQFLEQDLADLICATIAPILMSGFNMIDPAGGTLMRRLVDYKMLRMGDDLVLFGRMK